MSTFNTTVCCSENKRRYVIFERILKYAKQVLLALKSIAFIFADIKAVIVNDPAVKMSVFRYPEVVLYPGVWAVFFYRICHLLFVLRVPFVPRMISQLVRFFTGIEIHPGAEIGPGLFIDHGMGIVIGETAIIGKNVIMYHGVTLGGVESVPGKRHPTVGNEVIIGAGAKILGNINIGPGSRIGAQAVVLKNIPERSTAVGVPARILQNKYTR